MGTTGYLPSGDFPGGTCVLSTTTQTSSESSYVPDVSTHVDDDDVTSTMSESSSGIGGIDRLLTSKTTDEGQASGGKALHGHESDVDSGIVSYQLMDNHHPASISSSETDSSSRDSTSNEQKSRFPASDSTQCVRFDEQLNLSEENIRRSCRKLFATLYSHRFSYPCYNDSEILNRTGQGNATVSPPTKENAEGYISGKFYGKKLEPHSRLNIKNSGQEYESQRYCYLRQKEPMENVSLCNTFGKTSMRGKDFNACKNIQNVKPQYWRSQSDIAHSSPKLTSEIKENRFGITEPTLYSTNGKYLCKNIQNAKPQYWRSQNDIMNSSPKLTSEIKETGFGKTEFTLYSTNGNHANIQNFKPQYWRSQSDILNSSPKLTSEMKENGLGKAESAPYSTNAKHVCKNMHNVKPQHWRSQSEIANTSPKLTSEIKENGLGKTEPALYSTSGTPMNDFKNSETEFYRTRSVSTTEERSNRYQRHGVEQRLAAAAPLVSMNRLPSQRRNSLLPTFPSAQRPNGYPSFFNNISDRNKSLIHKSLSCTVLSTSENLSLSLSPQHDRQQEPPFSRRISDPISVSSLNISDFRSGFPERTSHQNIPQVTTRSSMVRAYARVVPIICDDSNSYTKAEAGSKPHGNSVINTPNAVLSKKHISYPVSQQSTSSVSMHSDGTKMKSSPPVEISPTHNGVVPARSSSIHPAAKSSSSSYQDLNYTKRTDKLKGDTRPQRGRSYLNGRNGGVVHNQPNVSEISSHTYASHKAPSNANIPLSNRPNAFTYKSLTLNHFKANGNHKSPKMEYEALDQSQKNRFNSLPVLDNIARSVDGKNEHLSMKAKRTLHQSDFTLYRDHRPSPSASSSGKSLLHRIQGFTRSAKNAVQRAFSTERIYRPEREERYEAQGQQKLKRSRSFIRGLKERMSKKKRREKKTKVMKPQATQVVIRECLNTSWDEPKVGPSSPTHVEGQLLKLNQDGSQVIELTKPPSKPYGFFVARGRIRNSRGVFVSRMRDQDTQEHLIGLLGIGDEILEIEGLNVKHADILEVNGLMSQRNSLILTVLPYVCRKD